MDKRVVIIHPSQIIRQGIHAMIRSRIDWDFFEFGDCSEMMNYRSISNSVIIFLVDDKLAENELNSSITPFAKFNSIKTLHLNLSEDTPSRLLEGGYISINCTKDQLLSLLDEQFGTINKSNQKRNPETTILTERERDILKLVALGKSNKEMAHQLSISIHTVISHRKNITEKLNIKSISGLTVYAILNRLLDAENIDLESLI